MTLENDTDFNPADDIGAKLKAVRNEQGISLREVADKAGITPSFLSQLERGNTQPSIVTLYRICKVLGISVSETLEPTEPSYGLVRAKERRQMVLPSKQVKVDVLIDTAGRPFDMILVKLAPGASTSPSPVTHDAREAMFIVSGQATFEVGGKTVSMGSGDTIYLNALTPHRMINSGKGELAFVNCIVGEI